ncbi:MAG TPA: GNAT family N-acetyltransferase [Gammaproteobacteria bacterium]|nr:GNAT family N-acetyltransferase [Gammaproteobacteria bacterium]
MSEILITNANEQSTDTEMLNGMFCLRYRVFHERLGWQVNCENGMEKDDFDCLDPTYLVARNEAREVEGCWRILPTTGAYMLKDIFPQLLCGEQAPEDENILELSRFAVAPVNARENVQAAVNTVTLEMIRSVFDFAERHGIKQYVTVTSVAMERLMKRIGIPMDRFGNKKAQRVGKVLSVACKVDINEQFRQAVYPARQPGRPRQTAA